MAKYVVDSVECPPYSTAAFRSDGENMTFQVNMDTLRAAAHASPDPQILDGVAIAAALRDEVKAGVSALKESHGIVPRLVVVMVGDDPASQIYVKHKIRGCEVVGIQSERRILPADISQETLHQVLRDLSDDPSINGILLQLPLPEHLSDIIAVEEISSNKDVDGFHYMNLGRLMSWASVLEPCTPRGVMTLLRARGVTIRGAHAVIVGRSMVVGRPMAQMLLRADATITVCHRHTPDLAEHIGRADIVVVATGVPELIKGAWIKEGATVIDVGISRVDGRIVGDVEFAAAKQRVSSITPVPGGVGPMTVATLLENTLRATLLAHGLRIENGIVS